MQAALVDPDRERRDRPRVGQPLRASFQGVTTRSADPAAHACARPGRFFAGGTPTEPNEVVIDETIASDVQESSPGSEHHDARRRASPISKRLPATA